MTPHILSCFGRVSRILFVGLVLLLGACADLVVTEVNREPFTGPNMVVKATVKNQGNRTAGPSTTALTHSYDWADPFVDTSRVATPSLDGGDSQILPMWVLSPTQLAQPGSCLHVRVCADVDDTVDEWREGNNCRTRSFMNRRFCRACDRCCDQTLPLTYDWRNVNGTNWVTAVRDQANCGSCWAFSAAAAVEAKHNVEQDASQLTPIDLSEQQLTSCPGGGGSCSGGWPQNAMGYISNSGIVAENTLVYTSQNCGVGTTNNPCAANCRSAALPGCANPLLTAAQCAGLDDPAAPGGLNPPSWRVGSVVRVTGNSVDDIKRALLCHGPLSVVSINWSHAILLVGWNANSWIIKNSWGAGWGNNGYGTIPFTGHNFSDIVDRAWYAQDVTRWP